MFLTLLFYSNRSEIKFFAHMRKFLSFPRVSKKFFDRAYDGGSALLLKPTNEILNTRGGNLITQMKLSTHHQSCFRDQKVHTTSTYLTKTAN